MIDLVYNKSHFMIGAIAIDAVAREVHQLRAEATEHPVEEGTNIADHFRRAPPAVQLEGVISDTPQRMPGSHTSGARQVERSFEVPNEAFGVRVGPLPVSIPGKPGQGSVMTFEPVMERVRDTWEEFNAIYDEGRLVTIVTTLAIYPNMVLRDLSITKKYKSYSFTCFATQIRMVKTGIEPALVLPAEGAERATPEVDKGKQVPTPEKDVSLKSLTKGATDGIVDMVKSMFGGG